MNFSFIKVKTRYDLQFLKKSWMLLFWAVLSGSLVLMLMGSAAFLYLSPKLPSAESYRYVRLENPLRIFSADGLLIAEYGDKKRDPIRYEDVPEKLVEALIAAEDKRFYQHEGVDPRGLARSILGILTGNSSSGGGGTLTMQVARQISFAGEDPYSRKFKEILLALQIERELTKQEIIELYLNTTFFGISAYGISAAAAQYYDKSVDELTLAEMATMIGILPSPNNYNPTRSVELALQSRNRVLRRMRDQGMITPQDYELANGSPLTARRYRRSTEVNAPYVAEMVRLDMIDRFGEERALTDGFSVYTTVNSRLQEKANQALINGLETYDRRHGYRGPADHLSPDTSNVRERWAEILETTSTVGKLEPAFVEAVQEQSFTALTRDGESVQISWEGIRWAKRYINVDAWTSSPKTASEVVEAGDLVRIFLNDEGQWELGQLPEIDGGLISIDPNNGQIMALVGGYDYFSPKAGKFNRVTDAERQPGSNFKPFLYTAAIANGYSASSKLNDAPLPRSDYRPRNFDGTWMGPVSLRTALSKSMNVVSLRLYEALGREVVLPFVQESFGFDTSEFTRDVTVAIGTQVMTPLEVATGYTVFANGGYKVEPYLIERIENFNDGVLYQANPLTVCGPCDLSETSSLDTGSGPAVQDMTPDENSGNRDIELFSSQPTDTDPATVETVKRITPAPRVVDAQVVYIMNSILRSVITDGSGRPAYRAFDRSDIRGKTGTTDDAADLWFSGFNGDLLATVFVGFDQIAPLGRDEQAATIALPIWIEYMQEALDGMPEKSMAQPDGLVTVRINEETGLRARPDEPNTVFEVFREDNLPPYGNSERSDELDIFSDSPSDPGEIF